MYKYRIQRWGLDKNIKEPEAWEILRLKAEREAIGKESEFRVRGKSVSIDDVLRYFRRKGIPDPEKRIEVRESPPPVECWTPPPSPSITATSGGKDVENDLAALPSLEGIPSSSSGMPYVQENQSQSNAKAMSMILAYEHEVPRAPLPSQTFLAPEKLFTSIRNYYAGAFSSGIFENDEKGQLRHARSPLGNNGLNNIPFDFFELCDSGSALMKSGALEEGRRHLSKASALARDLIDGQNPRVLDRFFQSVILLCERDMNEIVTIFRKFFQAIGKMFDHRNPLGQIFTQIGSFDESQFTLLMIQARLCVSASLADLWGVFHPTVLRCYMDTLRRERSINSLNRLRDLKVQAEQMLSKDDRRILRLKYAYGAALHDFGRHAEAVEALQDCLQHSLRTGSTSLASNSHAKIGQAYHKLGCNREAELNVRKSIDLAIVDKAYNLLPGLKTLLRIWYAEWGREDEAEKVKDEIDEQLGPDDVSVGIVSEVGTPAAV
jgi:tetratricopeptide (TPR) repeat protein